MKLWEWVRRQAGRWARPAWAKWVEPAPYDILGDVSVPVGHIQPPVVGKETKMAAKKKTVARGGKRSGVKIPKEFSGTATSRNDYLAGESVYPTRKKKAKK